MSSRCCDVYERNKVNGWEKTGRVQNFGKFEEFFGVALSLGHKIIGGNKTPQCHTQIIRGSQIGKKKTHQEYERCLPKNEGDGESKKRRMTNFQWGRKTALLTASVRAILTFLPSFRHQVTQLVPLPTFAVKFCVIFGTIGVSMSIFS